MPLRESAQLELPAVTAADMAEFVPITVSVADLRLLWRILKRALEDAQPPNSPLTHAISRMLEKVEAAGKGRRKGNL